MVFDTDGVLLDSAALHAAAWKVAFDGCLDTWAARGGEQAPFDVEREYRELVDGKARSDGARAFLNARRIALPPGGPDDRPGCGSVWAAAARKERAFMEVLRAGKAEAFVDARPVLEALQARNVRCAAVSASRHARPLLEAAGLSDLFDALVDGTDAARLGLPGKPDPSLFLEAAVRLETAPADTAVVEDALAGVEAARSGRFGLVIGLDRTGDATTAKAMRARGADIVTTGLAEVAEAVRGTQP